MGVQCFPEGVRTQDSVSEGPDEIASNSENVGGPGDGGDGGPGDGGPGDGGP